MIDQRFLDELFARTDIVNVVSKYVHLTKKGGNYFGICPFHTEKTPSFSVNGEKQIFHCFGCGVGGGAAQFLMRMENLEFREAVEQLAQAAGMEMPREFDDARARERERMLALLKEAARHFHNNLVGENAAPAVQYLQKRNLRPEIVTRFGLGYAPDSWSDLCDAMKKAGYTEAELLAAGLAKRGRSGRGVYDAFRNRLMFPVINTHGAVIAFSGRILGDGEPKYLNSPETPVFSKRDNLFALNLAKKTKRGYILLTEGNIDVVSLHQAGFDCAVASLGTSLTPEQVRLLSRYTQEVVLCYDSDEAGKKAAQRGIEILKSQDMKVRVLELPLPPGQKKIDPDEFIQKNGAEAFEQVLAGSEGQTEYRLRVIRDKYDLKTDDQKVAFLREAAVMLASIPNAVERDVFAGRAAQAAGVGKEALLIEVEKQRKAELRRERAAGHREDVSPARRVQPKTRELRYADVPSAMAEESLLSVLLQRPEHIPFALELCPPERFSAPALAEIYRAIADGDADPQHLSLRLSEELYSICSKLLMQELPEQERRTLEECAGRINAARLRKSDGEPDGQDPLLAFRDYKKKK